LAGRGSVLGPWACPQSRAAHHGYDWSALAGEDRRGSAFGRQGQGIGINAFFAPSSRLSRYEVA
jgi:hypothetical protein